MILRNGKIIKHTLVTFSEKIKIKYYILSLYEKKQKIIHYNNILFNNKYLL